MNPLPRQAAFPVSRFVFVLAAQYWTRNGWQRRAEEEREWKVGIPYDPGPNDDVRPRA